MAKNLPHYDVTHNKTETPNFFSLQTRRLAEPF